MTHESIKRVFRTAGLHLRPGVNTALVVDTKAGQPGDGLSLLQLVQTDGTLTAVLTQHVRVVRERGRCEAAQQVILNSATRERLGAERTADIAMSVVDTVEANPSLRHWALMDASHPCGSCADVAPRRVSITG